MLWVCIKYFLEPSSFSVLLFLLLAVAEAAALRLGIHRHTVRARVRRAGDVLDLAGLVHRGEEVAQIRLYIDICRHDP